MSKADENIIYSLALQAGVPEPVAKNFVSHAKHETGNFTHKFYRQWNNAFGYSYVKGAKYQSGPGTNADNGKPIATYSSVKNSVLELRDWWLRRMKEKGFTWADIANPEEYVKRLKESGYFGDTLSRYMAAFKAHWNTLTGLVASKSASIAVYILVAAAGFFFI